MIARTLPRSRSLFGIFKLINLRLLRTFLFSAVEPCVVAYPAGSYGRESFQAPVLAHGYIHPDAVRGVAAR
jgi:hypothetical protein